MSISDTGYTMEKTIARYEMAIWLIAEALVSWQWESYAAKAWRIGNIIVGLREVQNAGNM